MTTDEALKFLAEHQPMPSDYDVTESECSAFIGVMDHFEANPDARCIPLLINSVSANTGLGMYEHIATVLMVHPLTLVLPHLRNRLLSENSAIIYRCCWWACDLQAWGLNEAIRPFLGHVDDDLREAAEAFFDAFETWNPSRR